MYKLRAIPSEGTFSEIKDEMLAICAEIETWREKKESQEAQARYNARLYYKKWEPEEEE